MFNKNIYLRGHNLLCFRIKPKNRDIIYTIYRTVAGTQFWRWRERRQTKPDNDCWCLIRLELGVVVCGGESAGETCNKGETGRKYWIIEMQFWKCGVSHIHTPMSLDTSIYYVLRVVHCTGCLSQGLRLDVFGFWTFPWVRFRRRPIQIK